MLEQKELLYVYGEPRMRRKHPSKESREKIPRSQDKECALLRNSESGQWTSMFPEGGPGSYKYLQAMARIWDLTKNQIGFRVL